MGKYLDYSGLTYLWQKMLAKFAPLTRAIPSGGTSGQVLTKDSSTDYDVSWVTPSGGGGGGGLFDLIYDTPLYYWGATAISGTDSGSDDPNRAGRPYGELDASIENYDFLIVHFKSGSSTGYANLTNARVTMAVPVSEIEYLSTSQIESGTKTYELIYEYPAGTSTWYIDVSFGFTNSTTLYAKRRTYQNLAYWNIDKIYGVKMSGGGGSNINIQQDQNGGLVIS